MLSFFEKSVFVRSRRSFVSVGLSLLSLSALAMNGCAAKRMKADFISFEKAYAETSNREVLLNLARLQSHDTTYFFKLGQISSSYRMQASLTGAGNYVIQGTGVGGNATGGGTPGLIFENDPAFTFIPVNDETSAQLLLKPIPAQTLYNLYLQGWRVDQLFRLMVDRIELSVPHPDGTCAVSVFRNVPPPPPRGADTPGTNSTYMADAASYATFLRVSALVYALQRHGHLMLNGTSKFVQIDGGAFIPAEDAAGGAPKQQAPESGGGAPKPDTSAAPKASDFASAAAKNQSWRLMVDPKTGKQQWVLGEMVYGAEFSLSFAQPVPGDPKTRDAFFSQTLNDLSQDDGLKGLETGEGPKQVLAILNNKFSIEEPPAAGAASNTSCTQPSAHLVLRSLIGLMAAAAQEEQAFDRLKSNPNLLPPDKQLTFADAVPAIERQPALRLQWNAPYQAGPALVEVDYHGKYFKIADSAKAESDLNDPLANQYWNRDMFRLINQLTAQVTVDISKFPLPGILQVHQ